MASNPRQETLIVPAGGILPVPIHGRWLTILSNTAVTVDVSFDNDGFTPMFAGIPYPASGRYSRVRFRDTVGAGCTIVAVFSDEQAPDNRGSPLAAAMAASLASIDQEISGAAGCTQLACVNVPITGGLGVQLFAANPARTLISLSAPDTNGGIVYIGQANNRVAAADFMDLIYPGGNWYEERYKGAVFAVGNDALEWVGGYEV